MNLNFQDKVALITGGSSGIGRATAVAFAEEGAKVVVAARRLKEGNETVDMVKAIGGEAREYATQGIRINAVCPAVIQTPMAERGFYEGAGLSSQEVASWHRMNRLGTPAEVASAVLWLCSDGAGFVTGHALPIDGGMLS